MNSPIFVFNGDADGIISQHLMALSGIRPSLRITGLKRDISLLRQLPPVKAADLYVFDISLAKNHEFLEPLLKNPDLTWEWFDHHEAGPLFHHPRLKTHIHMAPGICTAMIVSRNLARFDVRWVAAASFGDNLPESSMALLAPLNLPEKAILDLKELGELLNYNAYGETEADVLIQPLELALILSAYQDPLIFHREAKILPLIRAQKAADELALGELKPVESQGRSSLYLLPAQPWAGRMGAVIANRLATTCPDKAIAILHPLRDGSLRVSIRSPRSSGNSSASIRSASHLASQFPTGGGRIQAAGINHLPAEEKDRFSRLFFEYYRCES